MIRSAIEKYPSFRHIVMVIKTFLAHRNLGDTFTGGVGSYLLSCLVLGFLQHHSITTQSRMTELTSLGHLLFDFFNFYAREFRVDRDGLSVRRGGSKFQKSTRNFEFNRSSMTNRRSLSSSDALCVESPLEPELDIGNKVFQWKVVRSAFMQARQSLVDEVQKYNPDDAMKSFLAPALINPIHPMFVRFDNSDSSVPDCPLTGQEFDFKQPSKPVPPSPYSDDEIVIEESEAAEEEEDNYAKRRRHSDEPRRYDNFKDSRERSHSNHHHVNQNQQQHHHQRRSYDGQERYQNNYRGREEYRDNSGGNRFYTKRHRDQY